MWHKFRVEVAERYGLAEAVLLSYVEFWCSVNQQKANPDSFHDGRWWMFNSTRAMANDLRYFTAPQIWRLLDKLVKDGALIVGNYNKRGFDRTRWYTLGDEVLRITKSQNAFYENENSILRNREMDVTKSQNASHETVRPIPIENPIENVNKEPNPPGVGFIQAVRSVEAQLGYMNGFLKDKVVALVEEVGTEVFEYTCDEAVRCNARSFAWYERTARNRKMGRSPNGRVANNDVAAAAADVQRMLAGERSNDGNDSGKCDDAIWGIWADKG